MSEIQVITSDLHSGSNTLNATAVELGKVQVQLGEIIDAAGDAYDGQLRQALEDIIGPGVYAGGRLQNRAGELGRELSDRAMRFEEANVAGQSATLNASTAYINYVESTPTLGFISIIKNKLQSIGQSIWNMAGLTLGGLMSRFFVKAKPSIPSSSASVSQKEQISTPSDTLNKVNEKNSQIYCSPIQGGSPVIVRGEDGNHYGGESKDGYRGVALDIGAKDSSHAEIHNIFKGTVIGIGPMLDDTGNLKDYGNYVKVLQDDGVVVLYAHLKEQPPEIKKGDILESSETIGMMGNTGRSTGPHLHLEFREPKYNNDGIYVGDTTGYVNNNFNPIDYLKEHGIEF